MSSEGRMFRQVIIGAIVGLIISTIAAAKACSNAPGILGSSSAVVLLLVVIGRLSRNEPDTWRELFRRGGLGSTFLCRHYGGLLAACAFTASVAALGISLAR